MNKTAQNKLRELQSQLMELRLLANGVVESAEILAKLVEEKAKRG